MSESLKAALWSFVTTFATLFVASIPLAKIVDNDWSWLGAAAASAAVAAARTAVAALNPKQTAYGVGKDKS